MHTGREWNKLDSGEAKANKGMIAMGWPIPNMVRSYQEFGLHPGGEVNQEHDSIMSHYGCSSVCDDDITTAIMGVLDSSGKVIRNVKVLLDSGCSRTLISIKFWNELKKSGNFKDFVLNIPFRFMCTNQEVETVLKAAELNLVWEGVKVNTIGGLSDIPFDIIMSWSDIKKNNLVPVFSKLWKAGLVRKTTVLGSEDESIENEFAYATIVEVEGLGEDMRNKSERVKSSDNDAYQKALDGCLFNSKLTFVLDKYKEVLVTSFVTLSPG